MNANANDSGEARGEIPPAGGGRLVDEDGPGLDLLPDRPWLASQNGPDAPTLSPTVSDPPCECPAPPLRGYLVAALVGALSLVVIVAGVTIGWNLGQRRDAPVNRPGGFPGLPVAQSVGEWTVVAESVPGSGREAEKAADRVAAELRDRGLQAGVVSSDGLAGLAPGTLAVWCGLYADQSRANDEASRLRSLGYLDASAREVVR